MDRYQSIIDRIIRLMNNSQSFVRELRKYQHSTLYFDGLRYALSIVQLTEQEEKHGNP